MYTKALVRAKCMQPYNITRLNFLNLKTSFTMSPKIYHSAGGNSIVQGEILIISKIRNQCKISESEKKNPFIVALLFLPEHPGQRTHSARTYKLECSVAAETQEGSNIEQSCLREKHLFFNKYNSRLVHASFSYALINK